MATPTKQEFLLRDIATTHVIFYPSRAHVTRTIGNINLQPGPNQIEIYGITPTADENSVKIDGTGASASITDMTVDLVPNKEFFEDAYPDDSDADQSDSDSDQGDSNVDMPNDDDDSYPPAARLLEQEIGKLDRRLDRARQIISTQQDSNGHLRAYCSTLKVQFLDASGANDVLDLFQSQQITTFEARQDALQEQDQLNKDKDSKKRELSRLTKQWRAEQRKKKKQAKKDKEKHDRQKAEKLLQAQRLREERALFWPKKVYRVVVHIDVPTDTPGSSRRSSFSSTTTLPKDPQSSSNAVGNGDVSSAATRSISLLLSYVTSDASWSPRYDISFSTPSKTGTIVYRAQFRNATSETWKDTKISLSTSQASFRGLDDEVPFMHPWQIGLIKSPSASALMAKEEIQYKYKDFSGHPAQAVNRAELFGTSHESASYDGALSQPFGGIQNPHPVPQPPPVPHGENRSMQHIYHHAKARKRLTAMSRPAVMRSASGEEEEVMDSHMDTLTEENAMFDSTSMQPQPQSALQDEDTTWEDNGLTQTYELPSSRTLEPSFLTRRHKIASLPFKELILTSISVPKLRPAAFLRARFRNPSPSITLLKGTAGLTLDGTFLGNTNLPRVSPGELITLPLGVDPSLQVAYSKPVSKRSTQGIFNKEAAQVYARNIFVTNTKPLSTDLLVLDQIPVSTDEKLRVEILQPKGLALEGDAVLTGVDAKQTKSKTWGRAQATLKKGGEVRWDVKLEKGAACRLSLEYEVRLPASEGLQSL